MDTHEMLWEDQHYRMEQSQGYFPDYDLRCFRKGDDGENQVIEWLSEGSDVFTLEVKNDLRAGETGNLYIELMCKGKPSGLLSTKATWFTIVVGDTMMTFRTTEFKKFVQLRATWAEDSVDSRFMNYRLTGTAKDPAHATRGLVVPIADLVSDFTTGRQCDSEGLVDPWGALTHWT